MEDCPCSGGAIVSGEGRRGGGGGGILQTILVCRSARNKWPGDNFHEHEITFYVREISSGQPFRETVPLIFFIKFCSNSESRET